ncbi:ribonuclease J [Candidatus Phytoplasma phoenicium]|uniref:Ribonuclease J1 n=1 Tax=Candidatus Phytoplasma phoenicium TaxID=198422 RepID=A0A0L0MIW6_9MOLU|nr:ribonuclease J [Candidatus Phytoplasma phoenicium]KND62592.1 Ribonuclease J1 [Candidatus Phytoplasma phoenicium]
MQEVNFSALGGLGEKGKNFYLLKIKSSYFVLDAGLKYPSSEIHGIDSIIPEYTRLEQIKHKIKGIFITCSLATHSGALPYLVNYLKVPIYSSNFAIEVLKTTLQQHDTEINIKEVTFKSIQEHSCIEFEDTKVSFFGLAHFLPETFGVVFETSQGSIVYMGEMHFLQPKNKNFQTNFNDLVKLTHKNKVLAFIAASQGSFSMNKQNKEDILEYYLSSYFSSIENSFFICLFNCRFD